MESRPQPSGSSQTPNETRPDQTDAFTAAVENDSSDSSYKPSINPDHKDQGRDNLVTTTFTRSNLPRGYKGQLVIAFFHIILRIMTGDQSHRIGYPAGSVDLIEYGVLDLDSQKLVNGLLNGKMAYQQYVMYWDKNLEEFLIELVDNAHEMAQAAMKRIPSTIKPNSKLLSTFPITDQALKVWKKGEMVCFRIGFDMAIFTASLRVPELRRPILVPKFVNGQAASHRALVMAVQDSREVAWEELTKPFKSQLSEEAFCIAFAAMKGWEIDEDLTEIKEKIKVEIEEKIKDNPFGRRLPRGTKIPWYYPYLEIKDLPNNHPRLELRNELLCNDRLVIFLEDCYLVRDLDNKIKTQLYDNLSLHHHPSREDLLEHLNEYYTCKDTDKKTQIAELLSTFSKKFKKLNTNQSSGKEREELMNALQAEFDKADTKCKLAKARKSLEEAKARLAQKLAKQALNNKSSTNDSGPAQDLFIEICESESVDPDISPKADENTDIGESSGDHGSTEGSEFKINDANIPLNVDDNTDLEAESLGEQNLGDDVPVFRMGPHPKIASKKCSHEGTIKDDPESGGEATPSGFPLTSLHNLIMDLAVGVAVQVVEAERPQKSRRKRPKKKSAANAATTSTNLSASEMTSTSGSFTDLDVDAPVENDAMQSKSDVLLDNSGVHSQCPNTNLDEAVLPKSDGKTNIDALPVEVRSTESTKVESNEITIPRVQLTPVVFAPIVAENTQVDMDDWEPHDQLLSKSNEEEWTTYESKGARKSRGRGGQPSQGVAQHSRGNQHHRPDGRNFQRKTTPELSTSVPKVIATSKPSPGMKQPVVVKAVSATPTKTTLEIKQINTASDEQQSSPNLSEADFPLITPPRVQEAITTHKTSTRRKASKQPGSPSRKIETPASSSDSPEAHLGNEIKILPPPESFKVSTEASSTILFEAPSDSLIDMEEKPPINETVTRNIIEVSDTGVSAIQTLSFDEIHQSGLLLAPVTQSQDNTLSPSQKADIYCKEHLPFVEDIKTPTKIKYPRKSSFTIPLPADLTEAEHYEKKICAGGRQRACSTATHPPNAVGFERHDLQAYLSPRSMSNNFQAQASKSSASSVNNQPVVPQMDGLHIFHQMNNNHSFSQQMTDNRAFSFSPQTSDNRSFSSSMHSNHPYNSQLPDNNYSYHSICTNCQRSDRVASIVQPAVFCSFCAAGGPSNRYCSQDCMFEAAGRHRDVHVREGARVLWNYGEPRPEWMTRRGQ